MTDYQVLKQITCGNVGVELLSNGTFFYLLRGQRIQWAHSDAATVDGRRISTKTGERREVSVQPQTDGLRKGMLVTSIFEENGLQLEQQLLLPETEDWISVQVFLTDCTGETVTRELAPIATPYPDPSGKPLFLSLDQRMLLVPYDNDMWVRYEETPLRPGRRSYDVTAIFDPDTREGLLVGALDHDLWKNAIACGFTDARSIRAFCGAADACTHDSLPHGCVRGKRVGSARFILHWCDDIRHGLEQFGDLCAELHPPLPWTGGVPFGFNTYSGLGARLSLDAWQTAGDLIHELPSFHDEQGATYINLDGSFGLDQARIAQMVKAFHARGQKVGTYCAPFVGHPKLGLDRVIDPDSGTTLRDLLLCDAQGRPLPACDNLMPLDCTHPLWEKYARDLMKKVVDMDFDYLKIDFLSHGATEGHFYDASIPTGRAALNRAYQILLDELSRAKHPIFISLSIAPLFPAGYGHARRCCCDSFGHVEDTHYVLNALTFGWWESGRLYHFNDPDHIALYRSEIDGRAPTTLEEARSRYNAAAISGTVMLLSDDFGPDSLHAAPSIARARALADQPAINALARLGRAFTPVELHDDSTAVFTLKADDGWYIACFNFCTTPQTVQVLASRADLPDSGTLTDLNRQISWSFRDTLTCALPPMASAILKMTR